MELLIEETELRDHFIDADGMYRVIQEWGGLEFDTDGEIMRIFWQYCYAHASGTVALHWLPSTIQEFHLTGTSIEGTVDLQNLPDSMEDLYLQRNSLSGTIDLSAVSSKFKCLVLHNNKFCGTIDLRIILPSMEYLCIENNLLEGDVLIGVLPRSLCQLRMNKNKFGTITDRNGRIVDDARVLI